MNPFDGREIWFLTGSQGLYGEDTLAQVAQAADAGTDIILLDKMSLAQLRRAVKLVAGRAKIEASGGVNLKTVRAIAQTGVDFISVGALTHSARAVDLGLDFE